MRVDTDRSRNGYHPYQGRKYDDRMKRRTYRNDDYHSHPNGNQPSRVLEKPRHHYDEEYSASNRIGSSQSTRFDRPTNTNHDIYSPLLTDLSGGRSPTAPYYDSSSSTRDRNSLSHYVDSDRNRYPPPPPSYRRDNSPPSSSSSSSVYRDDHLPQRNSSDLYSRDEYRSPTPMSLRTSIDTYNDMYSASDYNNRSERYNITPIRNSSSRDYVTASISPPVYRSDAYRTTSTIPLSSTSSSSPTPLTSSLYGTRDQYVQALPSVREVDYRSRNYGVTTSMDHHHHQIDSNTSSDRYYDDYRSSYRDRSRSTFHGKRPSRR